MYGNMYTPQFQQEALSGSSGWGKTMSYAGKGISAFGSLYAGVQQSIHLKQSAKAKEIEAKEAGQTSVWEQMRMLEEGRRLLGTQRAIYGQSGVTVEGTPTDVMTQTRREITLEKMMRARTGGIEKSALLADAKALKAAASAAKTGGVIGAFSSLF